MLGIWPKCQRCGNCQEEWKGFKVWGFLRPIEVLKVWDGFWVFEQLWNSVYEVWKRFLGSDYGWNRVWGFEVKILGHFMTGEGFYKVGIWFFENLAKWWTKKSLGMEKYGGSILEFWSNCVRARNCQKKWKVLFYGSFFMTGGVWLGTWWNFWWKQA